MDPAAMIGALNLSMMLTGALWFGRRAQILNTASKAIERLEHRAAEHSGKIADVDRVLAVVVASCRRLEGLPVMMAEARGDIHHLKVAIENLTNDPRGGRTT